MIEYHLLAQLVDCQQIWESLELQTGIAVLQWAWKLAELLLQKKAVQALNFQHMKFSAYSVFAGLAQWH